MYTNLKKDDTANVPLITIIVPVFRVEKYIRKCIESIINQTYQNLEVLLIDDGSDDGCPLICDEYSKKDKRIKVVHKKNGGLSEARNCGLEIAKGEYISFIDSDDFVESQMIERLYSCLKKTNSELSICSYSCVDEDGNDFGKKKPSFESFSCDKDEVFLLYDKPLLSWLLGVAWNKLYKKCIFDRIRYPIGKLHEDDFVSFLIYDECQSVAFVSDVLYHYTQRSKSIMKSYNIHHIDSAEAALNRIDFALKTKRFFLIPKAEDLALNTIFHSFTKALAKKEKEYALCLQKRYFITYRHITSFCNKSFSKKVKRLFIKIRCLF